MNDILVIDDSPENLKVLVTILAERGYQVRPALSGEIALKAVQEEIPDLVLLDIMMPVMDGLEVCRLLKSDAGTRDIPILFISALSDAEDKIKAFRAGGVDYISKPFHAEEVLARVQTHLALRNMNVQLLREIEVRKSTQEALQEAHDELEQRVAERTAQLDRETARLAEANIALKILLEKREEDKRELEETVLSNIDKLVLPYLDKLKKVCTDEPQKTFLGLIQGNLEEVTSSFSQVHNTYLANLTPAQIQIADLIKRGHTTKEIASLLNLSPATVACHRQEIRKRLSLQNRKINLHSALALNS